MNTDNMTGWIFSSWSQLLSLGSALLLSLLILLYPNVLVPGDAQLHHGLLSLAMLGISGGFVFGVGFVPNNRVLAFLLGPYLAWPVMVLSFVYLTGVIT